MHVGPRRWDDGKFVNFIIITFISKMHRIFHDSGVHQAPHRDNGAGRCGRGALLRGAITLPRARWKMPDTRSSNDCSEKETGIVRILGRYNFCQN